MAYIELNPNAVKRQDLLNLKAHLVAAKNTIDQIVREKDSMNEEQMQRLYGASIGEATFDNTLDGIQAALQAQAVINFISTVGTSDGLQP